MKHYSIPTPELLPETLILANGDFPTAFLPLTMIRLWSEGRGRLIACDGAADKLRHHIPDTVPDTIVGDLDSLSPGLRIRLADRLYHVSEQETNDLTKSIRYIREHLDIRRVTILGASGGREDHALGILSLLPTYAPVIDELVMLTDHGYFRLITEACRVAVHAQARFSVFSFDGAPLTLQGAEWPLEGASLPQLWCGTLNRACAPTLYVEPTSPTLLFVANE